MRFSNVKRVRIGDSMVDYFIFELVREFSSCISSAVPDRYTRELLGNER